MYISYACFLGHYLEKFITTLKVAPTLDKLPHCPCRTLKDDLIASVFQTCVSIRSHCQEGSFSSRPQFYTVDWEQVRKEAENSLNQPPATQTAFPSTSNITSTPNIPDRTKQMFLPLTPNKLACHAGTSCWSCHHDRGWSSSRAQGAYPPSGHPQSRTSVSQHSAWPATAATCGLKEDKTSRAMFLEPVFTKNKTDALPPTLPQNWCSSTGRSKTARPSAWPRPDPALLLCSKNYVLPQLSPPGSKRQHKVPSIGLAQVSIIL